MMIRIISRFATLFLLLSVACSPVKKTGDTPQPAASPTTPAEASTQAVPQPASAHIHFGRIGLEAGLSQSSVMAIVQDRQGFLWFGTEDGLNRYDGVKFKVFRPLEGDPASISDVWICTLALDADGALWVGTRQGGADRYDASTGKFTRYQHEDGVADSLSDNNVHVIFSDAQGRLWFGTGVGVDLFDPQTSSFEHFVIPKTEETLVQAIAQDGDGYLWVSTEHGLWRFDPEQKTFSQQKTGDEDLPIINILAHPDSTLWLATMGGGLIHLNPQTGAIKAYLPEDGLSHESVRRLLLDASGRIWVGTAYGLNLFNPASEAFINYFNDPNVTTSIGSNYIQALYQDHSGILWIGSYGGGLNNYDPLANKFTHYNHDPKNPKSVGSSFLFAFASAPDGTVWIGTYGEGLDHFDPAKDIFTHYRYNADDPDSLRNNFIWYALVARDGMVWVGTEYGLDLLDPATGKFAHFPSDSKEPNAIPGRTVYAIHQDSTGAVWVGTDEGLSRIEADLKTITNYAKTEDATGLTDNMVVSLFSDHNGALWLGTFSGGLSRLNPQTGTFKHYRYDPQKPGSISNDSILSIYESQSGNIWVGTAGGGLNRYDPAEDTFTAYNETDGLPNNVIYGILEDEAGNLWLSTNLGIARFNPQTGTSRNYTTFDGVQSNEFNMSAFTKDVEGRMYFGGVNGFNVFHPSEVGENRFVPPISLVSVTQNGIPFQSGIAPEALQEITIKYPDNSFEFEFAALSYSQAGKNQYAYMLQGFDNEWYYAGTDRTGRYSNLPGGEYTLRLKAANADSLWDEDGISLKVTVIPPFWRAGWFYVILALTFLTGAFGIYRLRVQSVVMQKRELERQVSERTREIERLFEQTKELAVIEERNRLARDLHDSAKQKAFAALAELGAARSLNNGNCEKGAKHLQKAETLVGEVIQEIAFLIQEIHPAALKEKGLASVLREYVFEWSNRTGIHVDLRIEGERRLPLEIEQSLYRSIQEALANVARHSGADNVILALTIQPGNVSMSMSDNGQGFDMNNKSNGMGLYSIRERMESVGGTFNIDSAPGKGTQLAIQIPIKE